MKGFVLCLVGLLLGLTAQPTFASSEGIESLDKQEAIEKLEQAIENLKSGETAVAACGNNCPPWTPHVTCNCDEDCKGECACFTSIWPPAALRGRCAPSP